MKNTVGTVISVCIVIALIALCLIYRGPDFSENQISTTQILLVVCCCSTAYCFVTGEITKNYSQMDKLWSILPIAYLWIIAASGGFDIRLMVYALIVSAWGIRLTVNFARKGAYRLKFWEGNEDYRWSISKK